jgi:hypothetical protein
MNFADPSPGADAAPLRKQAEPDELVLRDCLFLEAMPLSWAWAYRRLLDPGTERGRSPHRIA